MMKRLNLRWPALALISAILAFTPLLTNSAFAQGTDSGTLIGVVKDPSGALIPGATISLVNLSTKEKLTTVTNKDGAYTLPGVPPAHYVITATKQGFATDQIDDQPITVGSQTTANFALAVGAESTIVEVVASNADLQTLNATIGDTVTSVQIASMPAIARDISTFATLQPGVSPGGSVAGTVSDQAVFMVDGGNNSSDMDGSMQSYTGAFGGDPTDGKVGNGASGVMPTPQDSVEQFKVATAGQTADFNNSSGSQVQIVTKRGTNQWRGTAYEYYLDSSFGGAAWQNSWSNTAKSIYHYSRFGAAAGGPIAPYFLGGKTYLFANYEGFRYPNSSSFERVVPSTSFEAGNIVFGCVANSGNCPTTSQFSAAQIKADDPRNLGLDPTVAAYWKKFEPQQGTTYPGGHFDPNANGCSGLSSSTTCDGYNTVGYITTLKLPQTSNFFVARLDHDFGTKEHFFTSYRWFRLNNLTSNQTDIGGYFTGDTLGQGAATDPRPQDPWYLVAGLTTNISATFTSTFHFSYLRNLWSWGDNGAPPPPGFGLGAALEAGGESATTALAPITEANQSIRTRFWDGHDYFLGEDLTKLKGNHLIQFGGQYQRNFNYHQRTDNGGSVNYYPVYQLGETGNAGLVNLTGFNANGVPSTVSANARLLAMNTGIITDNQIVYTRSGSNLTLNPPLTPAFDQSTIRFYNMYISDTWHAKPSLTANFGLGYAIEMPPVEANGKIVTTVDGAGNQIYAQKFLAARAAAAALGQVYNPEIGYALDQNTSNGGVKYPYAPFYKSFSPRISLAWNPKIENKFLKPITGENATVIRGSYGRVYGRLNGVGLVLTTLLSPGLIQSVDCQNLLISGACGSASTDATNFRIGTDGNAPAPPAATATLPQPFYPGYNGSQTSSAQALDPSLRPSSVDSFNLTIQRQLSRKTLLEFGYIGRIIKNEWEGLQLDDAPYMLSQGGQSFQSAYLALEQAFGCTINISTCQGISASAAKGVYPTFSVQPFFETALAGSKFCTGYTSCTAGVVAKEEANIAQQKVWQLFSDLDNGGFTFPGYSRIMTQTPIPGAANGAAGQLGTGTELVTSAGYGNYHGGFITFKMNDWHGLTLTENFTYSKALGLADSAQSSSDLVPNDGFDLRKSYGLQSYNQKFIMNIFGAYQTPWFKNETGIVGRLLGGWNIAPIFAAGSGTPKGCSDNGSTSEAFGGGNGTFGDNEQCVFTTPRIPSETAYRGVLGGTDAIYSQYAPTTAAALNIGTATISRTVTAGEVNIFPNPVAVWDSVRPEILGLDEHNSGEGVIAGLRYWNMDLQVRKTLKVWERTSLEISGISTNVLNHMVFSNPGLSLTSPTGWGVTSSQGNSPRQIQMGIRANF
jgi:hypothetical protein